MWLSKILQTWTEVAFSILGIAITIFVHTNKKSLENEQLWRKLDLVFGKSWIRSR